jgi:hypothetical protein
MELNYDGTSSEEEKPNSNDQPVPTELINQNIQPVSTEPINKNKQTDQNIQQAQATQISQTPKETIQHPHGRKTNKKAINPACQNDNQTLPGKRSTLGNPFNPTGLSPTQWERQKSMFTNVLDGYTSPGGGQVNIQNLMMLAFTQNQQDGASQLNLMAQNQTHINLMAQQQKELLEQQAAASKQERTRYWQRRTL